MADILDVNQRTLSLSSSFRAIQRSALISGCVIFAAFVYWASSGSLVQHLSFTAAGAAFWYVFYPFIRQVAFERRLRRYWKEQLGSEGPFTLEVELSDAGVRTWQFGTETLNPWPMLTSVSEKNDSVELMVKQRGLIVVRERAFSTTDEKRRFIELARHYLRQAAVAPASF